MVSSNDVRIGVIGLGYWGPNIVRNIQTSNCARVAVVYDTAVERAEAIRRTYGHIDVESSLIDLLAREDVDALVVATPSATHFEIAMSAIRAGKHVWVEKPLALSQREVAELGRASAQGGVVVFVDHTFTYTGAVEALREIIGRGELGDVLYFDATRTNLGVVQQDCNVIQDLAPHDLSILFDVVDPTVERVAAFVSKQPAMIAPSHAYIICECSDGMIAHLHCNWWAPVKVRSVLIGGSRKMAVYDDTRGIDKLRVFDSRLDVQAGGLFRPHRLQVSYRMGDLTAPALDPTEALSKAVLHFVDCISGGVEPRSGITSALKVASVIDAAVESVRLDGEWVKPQATTR
jgi:predicted dehydrogenase